MYLERNYNERSICFWDFYAKWYDLWIRHNTFHKSVIDLLYRLVEPGWKVLDIGAGNGVLSIVLHHIGCMVKAVEPSIGMRDLLYKELIKHDIQSLEVDTRRWEDIPSLWYNNYDLVIACNSLHLMDMPFEMALRKVFSMEPKNFLLVTELEKIKGKINFYYGNYSLKLARVFKADTSFAYHNLYEAFEHHKLRVGRNLTNYEKKIILKSLVYDKNHYWQNDEAYMGIYYFTKTNGDLKINLPQKNGKIIGRIG